ncbi:MAG: hypothetical protein ACQGVK_10680 [Myxococcota bacterium]
MARTRLRGLDLAGLRMAVEVPGQLDWRDPETEAFGADCAPCDPDIYVGVRVGQAVGPLGETTLYASGRQTFEIGRDGSDWLISIHGRSPHERVARFDADFREGEVIVAPDHAAHLLAAGGSPVAHPLDELLVLHRILRSGGLVLRGSLIEREGRALVFVGHRCAVAQGPMAQGAAGWRRLDPMRAAGDRVVVRFGERGPQVQTLPWTAAGLRVAAQRGDLDAIHLLERAEAVFTEPVLEEEAAGVILANAFAPVHDSEGAGRSGALAERLARCVPVVRMGMPAEERIVPFKWGQTEAALAFAPPL